MKRVGALVLLALVLNLGISPDAVAQPLSWEVGPTGTTASLRGLHAVNDNVVWACGSGATVLRSSDGGSSWTNCSPNRIGDVELTSSELRDIEFRSLHAWSESEAVIASAGTPAVILQTRDGGASWQQRYRSHSDAAFFDGMIFWDAQHGIAFSDPVNGHLLIVESSDGGKTWTAIDRDQIPAAIPGEAGFAASDSSICVAPDGKVMIGTGGAESQTTRIYLRQQWDAEWTLAKCPMIGGPAKGIFSIANCRGTKQLWVSVGGDYRPGKNSESTAAISRDGGRSWNRVSKQPNQFRSAVACLPNSDSQDPVFVAVGPTGGDYSVGGDEWVPFSKTGFHALSVGSQATFACGSDGRFAVLRGKLSSYPTD